MRLRPANGPNGREFPETDASIRKNRELDVRLTDVARVSGKGSARGRSPGSTGSGADEAMRKPGRPWPQRLQSAHILRSVDAIDEPPVRNLIDGTGLQESRCTGYHQRGQDRNRPRGPNGRVDSDATFMV